MQITTASSVPRWPYKLNVLSVPKPQENTVEDYLEWKSSHRREAARVYRPWVERFHDFVGKSPEMITLSDVVAFSHQIKTRYSEKTLSLALTVVKNYLGFLNAHNRIRFSLSLVRVPSARANSHRAVSEEEYRTIMEVHKRLRPDALRDRLIIQLLHDTGMRVGELRSLDLDDIHDDMSATIRSEKTCERRRVFWNPDTDEILQRYLVKRVNDGPDIDALFVSESRNCGGRLGTRSICRVVKEGAELAGLKIKISPHSYRHAFIHRLAKIGVPDAIIAVLVGHTTPLTISHYTKLSRPEYEEAFRRGLVGGFQRFCLAG